jgi:hypothetical protein
MSKKSRSGIGINIPDHISESLETIFGFKIPKFFYADFHPGSGIFFTRDPGWKIWIRDPLNNPDPQQLKNTLEKSMPFNN